MADSKARKPKEQKHTNAVTVRFTDAQFAWIKMKARRVDDDLSTYVKRCALEQSEFDPGPEEPEPSPRGKKGS